ncbi:MAG TPA: right-handed parallel beta-helix repeat-containing protein [Anaerohalosphaeraceae bacterium]|nr:right-handed parallel beta-helix repeat-containing protein [Anaerohalosphaeraceae bacterium]HRT51774.1 right-handed parallel beta-helix repeat-containing protein [Anaerohalosphaeraceae bacterium]HRT87749.1 right-handed parallel beta-helix repeat-containing protein [Anaerohalosphaeraceae bacterium]
MGYPVFYGHRSVFFVGGNGDKSGRTALAGGCTQEWWDSQCPNGTDSEKTAAMNKLMVNGGPVADEAGCAFTGSDRHITKAGCFAGVEVGMAAYVVETPVPDVNLQTMRYHVTAVDPAGDWIAIGDASGGNTTVTVKVGGAFDTLQSALDETDASLHSVTIWTNLDETLAGSVSVDAGGNVLYNTFKRIVGFHTVPGDMGRGGGWHESPLTILRNGVIDTDRCVSLNGNSGGFSALYFYGADNLIFENVHLRDTGGQSALNFATVCRNIVVRNCRFSGVSFIISTEADHVLFDGCYSHNDILSHQHAVKGHNNVFLNCVGRMATGTNLANVVNRGGSVIGCIVVGGQFGVRVAGAGGYANVLGNTFIGTEVDGVLLDGCDGVTVVDNVFSLAPGAVGIFSRSGGSVPYNDHNCFIETDGTPAAMTGTSYAGAEAPDAGEHSVGADPDFANAAGYDLRPRNPAVLRGGRPQPDGTAPVIGAIGQKYVFPERGRMVNAGRAGVMR